MTSPEQISWRITQLEARAEVLDAKIADIHEVLEKINLQLARDGAVKRVLWVFGTAILSLLGYVLGHWNFSAIVGNK